MLMPEDNREAREGAITEAIKRTQPGVENVLFDEDGEHVYGGPVESDGAQVLFERDKLRGVGLDLGGTVGNFRQTLNGTFAKPLAGLAKGQRSPQGRG
jgi:hypothetical protein